MAISPILLVAWQAHTFVSDTSHVFTSLEHHLTVWDTRDTSIPYGYQPSTACYSTIITNQLEPLALNLISLKYRRPRGRCTLDWGVFTEEYLQAIMINLTDNGAMKALEPMDSSPDRPLVVWTV